MTIEDGMYKTRIAEIMEERDEALEMLRDGQGALANDGIDIGIVRQVPETEEWSKRLDAFLAQYEPPTGESK